MTTVEERKWRRATRRWRWLALLLALALIGVVAWNMRGDPRARDHVARVDVGGFITGNRQRVAIIDRLARSPQVKAVIVRINSPGGTTAGAEALYRALRRLAERKPVVAVMDTIAASGGYVVALAADRIIAQGNTLTGSIGVVVQWPEMHELMNRLGVRMNVVRSGPLKARPNTFEPLSEEARAWTERVVRDSHQWFLSLLAQRRQLPPARAEKLADGRIFTGRQALREGLVDELGDEHAARAWLARARDIARELPAITHAPPPTLMQQLGLVPGARGLVEALTALLAGMARGGTMITPPADLDGLLSVWHPRARPGN